MIGKLLLIEWIKARRRKTFWLALLACPLTATLMMLPVILLRKSQPDTIPGIPMPDSWPSILNASAGTGGAILAAALALLVASEGSWRTQRQNVIDGLSRTEYVAGKHLLGLAFAALTWTVMLLVATILGHLGSRADGAGWTTFAEPVHFLMMGGGLLSVVMTATVGVFFGLLLGSGGAALGCTVLFIIGQGGILTPILMVKGGGWLEILPFLPTRVAESLGTAASYDAAQNATLIGNSTTGALSAGAATLVAMLYIALFAWGGWAAIRYRDL